MERLSAVASHLTSTRPPPRVAGGLSFHHNKPRRSETKTEHVAPNWVSWVLPKPLAWKALAMLFGGFIKEDQEADFDKAGKKWQRRDLINIITRYTGK